MPYAFPPVSGEREGTVKTYDVPVNEWLGLKFGAGQEDTFGNQLSRFLADQSDNSAFLTKEEWEAGDFSVGGEIKWNGEVRIDTAIARRDRKIKELRYQADLNAASHAALSAKGVAGFGAMMVGSMAHPLDFAMNFIPFIGQEKFVAGAGGMAYRGASVLGTTTADIAKWGGAFKRFPNLTASVINGTLGNLIVEVPVATQKWRDQADYGAADFAANIGFGAVAAGTLHGLGAAMKKLAGIREIASESSLNADQMVAMRNIVNGTKEPSPLRFDESVVAQDIIQKNAFDEVKVREEALKFFGKELTKVEGQIKVLSEALNKGRTSADDLLALATAGTKSANAVQAKITSKLLDRFKSGERSANLFQSIADLYDLRYDPKAPTLDQASKQIEFQARSGERPKVLIAREQKAVRTQLFDIEKALKENLDRMAKEQDPLLQRRLSSNSQLLQAERDRLANTLEGLNAEAGRATAGPLTPDELLAHADELEASGKFPDGDFQAMEMERLEGLRAEVEMERDRRIAEHIQALKDEHAQMVSGKLAQAHVDLNQANIEAGKVLTEDFYSAEGFVIDDATISKTEAATKMEVDTMIRKAEAMDRMKAEKAKAAGLEYKPKHVEAAKLRAEARTKEYAGESEAPSIGVVNDCITTNQTD